MKAEVVFDVLIRAMGVWEFVHGIEGLPQIAIAFSPYENDRQFFGMLFATTVSVAGLQIILGCFLFFGANWIVRLAYPRAAAGDEVTDDTPGNREADEP